MGLSPHESAGRYQLRDEPLNIDDATRLRNLGCPHYNECLCAASAELNQLAAGRRKRKNKTWKLARSACTWICNPQCSHREAHELFHLELLQSTRER